MKIKTDNYFLKKIVNLLFSEKIYHKIKLYKIIYDYKVGKTYEDIDGIIPKLINTSAVVMDIGANMGQYACRLNKFIKDGSIYSIEPFSLNYSALVEMKRILKLNKVRTYHLAVSDSNSLLTLRIPVTKNKLVIGTQAVLESYERVNYDDVEYRLETVSSITIDKFIFDEKIKKVDLIKIDTEGAEISVLKGELECLKLSKPNLIVEINPDNKELGFLYDLGYEAYITKDSILKKYDKHLNGKLWDTIFIHKEKQNIINDKGNK